MTSYACLLLPSANRVYAGAAAQLAVSELEVMCGVTAQVQSIAGVQYLMYEGEADLDRMANHSSLYALFCMEGDLLRPVQLHPLGMFDDDLVTIPRYTGKTNEQFTKLLLNVTLAHAPGAKRLLDPVCGRGTTMHHALRYGLDVAGIEIDRHSWDAWAGFFSQWLQDKRIKHREQRSRVKRAGKLVAQRLEVTIQDGPSILGINDDTLLAADHFGKSSVDVIVADLPYGVQHAGNVTARKRTPGDLLRQALPVWRKILRTSGAIGMSFNTRTLPRDMVVALLANSGFAAVETPDFAHRVDASIQRDLVIAKPL